LRPACAGETPLEEALQRVDWRHLATGALQDSERACPEQIQALDEKAALVCERGVEAAAADTHGLEQIAQ
jgi:hypothetical protein